MDGFDQLWIWDDAAVAVPLDWYRSVAANRLPAKFRIAATIPVDGAPADADEDALWQALARLTPEFLARRDAIRAGETALGPRVAGDSLLELCRTLAGRMLSHCNFCAWNCRVDRSRSAKVGACKLAAETRVSSFFHHPGEELVFRGTHGSGTIFFTSCNMRCAFCQNGDISTDKDQGVEVEAGTLAAMAWLLRLEGCHNINWVGGDPLIHLHRIVEAIALLGGPRAAPTADDLNRAMAVKADGFSAAALSQARATYGGGFNAPMLWNSNFYLSDPAARILRLLMDVWLPDLKFGPGRCAITLARTPRYWETVTRFLKQLYDAGEDMAIRHLVMPGHVACCTIPILDWIAEAMPGVPVNIMDQYRPDNFCHPHHPKYDDRYAEMTRRPTGEELRAAVAHARDRRINFEAVTYEKRRSRLFA